MPEKPHIAPATIAVSSGISYAACPTAAYPQPSTALVVTCMRKPAIDAPASAAERHKRFRIADWIRVTTVCELTAELKVTRRAYNASGRASRRTVFAGCYRVAILRRAVFS